MPETFQAWSLTHWTVIAVTLLATTGAVSLRRRLRDDERGRRLDRVLAVTAGSAWVVFNGWQVLKPGAELARSLPLHISDVLLLVVAVAMWTRWRWAQSVVYFWGLGLGTLAYVMPDLRDGPGTVNFWIFWGGHLLILLAVAYELVARGYRPGWRDWAVVAGLGLGYVAVILPINAWTGYTYGYLGPDRPGLPTMVLRFGAWPLRVLPMIGAALAMMALLVLPWKLASAGVRKDEVSGS